MRLLLDTNMLLRLCHPSSHADVREWYRGWLNHGRAGGDVEFVISAVADYELRRGYMYTLDRSSDARQSLAQLDELCQLWEVQQISARNLHDAASMWADARRNGIPTASDRDVDWDILIAAQAKEEPAIVVTSNQKHFRRYGVEARDWHNILVPEEKPGA
ncbi:MAG: PIN domain-containing protein [Planctomycetes bacterium]|nr:PIN domain-containing protein [Planctomycetota bacterium]